MVNAPRLIALDWGSSQLRAYLLGDGGAVLAERHSADGASRLAGGAPAFEQALAALVSDWWADGDLPVLACGMVGSAHGWREVPYAACPVALDSLHQQAGVVRLAGQRDVRIVPGLCWTPADGPPDVMRGEETQVLGLLAAQAAWADGATLVLPGTHSKWVSVRDGRVTDFATHMTGELFALLCAHSVLGRLMQPAAGFDTAAFQRGVRSGASGGGAALGRWLFSVRTLGLFQALPPESLADYLSGLLIGSELGAALPGAAPDRPLVLAGEPVLCERYALALGLLGRTAALGPQAPAAAGLWRLARQAGWVGG